MKDDMEDMEGVASLWLYPDQNCSVVFFTREETTIQCILMHTSETNSYSIRYILVL